MRLTSAPASATSPRTPTSASSSCSLLHASAVDRCCALDLAQTQLRPFAVLGIWPKRANRGGIMTRETRNTMTLAVIVLLVVIFAALSAVRLPAGAQTSSPQSEGQSVDYWQPLWMQRELWGPGQIPPGMRARL